jgi:hypothetical protein
MKVALNVSSAVEASLQIGENAAEKVVKTVAMNLSSAQVEKCTEAVDDQAGQLEKCLASQVGTFDPSQIALAKTFRWISLYHPHMVAFDTSQVVGAKKYCVTEPDSDGAAKAFIDFFDKNGNVLGHVVDSGVGLAIGCR